MKKVIRNLKRAMSIVLVVCVIFTSQAFMTFAENVGNDDETRVEEINETETTVEEIETIGELVEESEDLAGESEDLVGVSTASPKEKSDESEIEEPEDDTDEFLETDYLEEPEEDPTIAEITESTEDESTVEAFDEQETIENEQNSSGRGSETEETNIEDESEETLAIEEINHDKNDKLYGATPYTAYIYYLTYNSSDRKYEKTHTAIQSDADPFIDSVNDLINQIYNDTNVPAARLQNWYVMNPSDPTTADNDAYDHFNSGSTIGNSPEALRGVIMNWYSSSPTENFHIGAGFDRCTFNYMYLHIGDFTKPEERSKTVGGTQEGYGSSAALDMPLDIMKSSFGYVDGIKGWYVHNPANPSDPTEDYDPYRTTADYNGFEDALKAAYDDWNSNTPVGNNIYLGAIYDDPSTPSTYTLKYNQNLPTGYTLNSTTTWYEDETKDLDHDESFTIKGSSDMTCSDSNGTVRTLLGWADAPNGVSIDFEFAQDLASPILFSENQKTLYAVWSGVFHVLYYASDADYSSKTLSHMEFTGDNHLTAVTRDKHQALKQLTTPDLAGFYYIGDSSNVEYYKGRYDANATIEYGPSQANLQSAYSEWLKGPDGLDATYGAIYYGKCLVFNYIISGGALTVGGNGFKFNEKNDFVDYLNTVENDPPTGKRFKCWQIWTSGTGYDYSAAGEVAYYESLAEDSSKVRTITQLESEFDSWVNSGYRECMHVGAIYEDETPTPPTPTKTVESIAVKSSNTTTIAISDDFSRFSVPFISNSESFDPNGMVITVTYDDGSTADVTYNNTTASQFTITYNAASVDIVYGGKSVSYDFSVASEPNFYIYFNDNTNVKRAMGVYDSSFVSKIEDLYNYVSSGRELGFYVINATGLQDAYNKYNANATATMTLTEAMAEAQNITSVSPMTQYTFWGVTNRSKSQGGGTITSGGTNFSGGGDGGGSSSGASDPTKGPMGDLTKSLDAIRTWLNEQINTSNDIPQSSLLKDDSLASYLKSSSENINRPYTNAQDENGNRGYGQWLRVPNTTTWYFFSGDLSQLNGQSSGFLANGWYNLGWDGQEKWYYFDANGVMKIGWHVIGGKMYYLDSNLSYNWYGSRVTGAKVIDGISYSFTDKGELNTTVGNNNIDTSQLYSQFVDNTANYNSAAGGLPPFNTPDTLPNQNEVHFYGGELSGPDMMAPVIAIY